MRKNLLLCCLGLLLSAPSFADWSPTFSRGFYQSTISFNGSSRSVSEAMTSNGHSNGPMSALARSVYAMPHVAKNTLDNEVRALAASQSGSGVSAYYVTSSISGQVRLGLTGLSGAHTGLNQASVSGLSYSALIRATGSFLGISGECDVRLTVSNVAAVVAYDPYSGIISTDPALSNVQLNPTSSVSCSSSIDFIPILGDLANALLERMIPSTTDFINNFASAALRDVIPMGPQYLGLYNVITPGQYVINGVDVGAYLRNNFASYFTGRTLTLTFGPENIVESVAGVAGEPDQGPYTGNAISVDFSDANTHLSFSLADVRHFTWRYVCKKKPRAQSCIEP